MTAAPAHRFPRYGTLGLVILVLMETAAFCAQNGVSPNANWEAITTWMTPACWWGYILVVDAWLYRRQGHSLLTGRRDSFVIQCILSVAFWCLFEGYNRVMPGWRYINLEPHLPSRFVGYVIAFATIMPGLFLTCELVQSYGLFSRVRCPQFQWHASALMLSSTIGAAFVIVPPFFPESVRGYFWAFVWMGWVFLLEPFNYRRGAQSLYRDWERGQLARTLQLATAGAVCGLLWEFWNMWAYTKWEYTFPVPTALAGNYFEMPLIGFPGFLSFAIEYFVMFHFISSFFTTDDKLEI